MIKYLNLFVWIAGYVHAEFSTCKLNGAAMKYKLSHRYRTIFFAFIMSLSTALIVSGTIIYFNTELNNDFLLQWLSAFVSAWPIVFVSILVVAPLVNKILDVFIEWDSNSELLSLDINQRLLWKLLWQVNGLGLQAFGMVLVNPWITLAEYDCG